VLTSRLLASNHLGPMVFASFSNGLAREPVYGRSLSYETSIAPSVYPAVAAAVGAAHRLLRPHVMLQISSPA